eukprot:COSAG05_NODE_107_length_18696_cov_209.227766_22_plen_82_part_00
MRASVLATERAFSSQRAPAAGGVAGCRSGSPRARTHSANSTHASSQISEFRSCMHDILLHACDWVDDDTNMDATAERGTPM